MIIKDDKLIKAIQKEFRGKFPYLKLEFYKKHHDSGEGSPDSEKLDSDSTIGAVRTIHNTGDLGINGNMKVITLEQEFDNTYGLNVQVFRKSGELWLQTISTDGWTLTEQNEQGAVFSNSN